MREIAQVTDAEVHAIVGRLLVAESAKAAGLLVACPTGGAVEGVMLVASRQPRKDSTLACVLVRIQVVEGSDSELSGRAPPAGAGERLAVVDWEHDESSGEQHVYLISETDACGREGWLKPEFRATPERWASLFQVSPESSSG
jgi:hypothetical protein